jgi:predicted alpha/beta hydrolase
VPPRVRAVLIVMICLALVACAVSSPQAAQTPSPTSRPIPTDTPPADTFYFTTEDGVTLNGQVIGSGKTALVFSNGQTVPKFFWLPVAQRLASQGYLCLLYDYRGLSPSQGQNDLSRRDRDLQAAVAAARALALAAQIQPKAIIILSGPQSADAFTVSEAALKALTETGSSPPHATGLQPQWSGVWGFS